MAKFSHVWSHCIFVCDDDDVDDDVDEVKACVEVGIVLSVHMMLRLWWIPEAVQKVPSSSNRHAMFLQGGVRYWFFFLKKNMAMVIFIPFTIPWQICTKIDYIKACMVCLGFDPGAAGW